MKIKGYRVMAGYSQKDMANLLKMGIVSYGLKESGKREFYQSELESLYKILLEKIPNLKVEDLMNV